MPWPNFSSSDEDSYTTKNRKRSKKNKEREDISKKRRNNSLIYCSLHGENTNHNSRGCKVLKARAEEKYKSKYVKKEYKKKFKELNLLQEEASHQKPKYEKLNKAFTKRKTYKEETVNISDSYDFNSSSSSLS